MQSNSREATVRRTDAAKPLVINKHYLYFNSFPGFLFNIPISVVGHLLTRLDIIAYDNTLSKGTLGLFGKFKVTKMV